MPAKLLDGGFAVPETDDDGIPGEWRREKQRLEDEMLRLRHELEESKAENQKLRRSVQAIQKPLTGIYHGLRALFGEIEFAVGKEEPASVRPDGPMQSSGSVDVDRWNGIKQRLSRKQAELVDVLLLQGRMNRTQCAKAIKSDYTFCRKSVVTPLIAQGLLIEGGDGLLELKQL